MTQNLVSIIIPVYNRSALIRETLDSIIAQTYKDWECIIVDDGSQDDSLAVVEQYVQKDARFRSYKRPTEKQKGANACRNFGFEQSKGAFVIWFDSDDLMLPQKIARQLQILEANPSLDFCVARFKNMNGSELTDERAFDPNANLALDQNNYVRSSVFWGTIDFLGKRSIFEGLAFNETLKSGQEYNFFTSVLANRPKGFFLDEPLTLRRIHGDSIQQAQQADKLQRLKNKFNVYWATLIDHRESLVPDAKKYLMLQSAIYYHKLLLNGIRIIELRQFIKAIRSNLGIIRTVVIYLLMLTAGATRKGDRIGSRIIKTTMI